MTLPLYLTHGTYNCYAGKLQCRCDECRQAMKDYMDRWRLEHGQAVGPFMISCVTCGSQFETAQSSAKYCSKSCKPQYDQSKKRKCRCCSVAYPVATEPTPIVVGLCKTCRESQAELMTTCLLCGVVWWDRDGQRYCSEKCEELAAMRQAIIEEDYL